MATASVLMTTDLSLPLFIRGKVRDTYALGDRLLIVATDRISAFDVAERFYPEEIANVALT